jgi:hypothetical protein
MFGSVYIAALEKKENSAFGHCQTDGRDDRYRFDHGLSAGSATEPFISLSWPRYL